MDRPVTCVRARTSDRTPGGGAGAEALARLLGGEVVGEAPVDPRPRSWEEDLAEAGPALDAAAAAAEAGHVITASDCTICMATFPVVARRVPGVRFLWLDAHGDFNLPDTTPSGFLGGMCLAAACGVWGDLPEPVDPRRVSFVGVRDLDPGEARAVERAGVGTGVPGDGPVYVHLDVDVLDPSVLPAQFPVPDGLQAGDVREILAGLGDRLAGLEVTALEHPEHAGLVAGMLEA